MAGLFDRFKSNNNKEEEKNKDIVFYLFPNFEIVGFAQNLINWIESEKKWEANILQTASYPILQYRPSSKLGAKQTFHLKLFQEENLLSTEIYAADWVENYQMGSELVQSKKNWLSGSYEQDIHKKIGELIVQQYKENIADRLFIEPIKSKYIEEISPSMQCFLYASLQQDETILSFLKVSTVKKSVTKIPEDYELNFMLTDQRILLIANHPHFQEVIVEDLSGQELTVIDEVGRDPVTVGENKFLTQLTNDGEFRAIAPICNANPVTRCGKMALLHLLQKDAKNESLQVYIHQLLTRQVDVDPTNRYHIFVKKIIHFFNPYSPTEIGEENRETILGIFKEYIASDENVGKELLSWFIDWQFKKEFLFELLTFLRTAFLEEENHLAKRLIPLFQKSRVFFIEKEKNQEKVIQFELELADFLANIQAREEAAEIYEEIYQKLPDETLSDLLLPANVNIQEGEGGQVLKITLLEKMVEAKGEVETADAETALRLACLQPLVKDRLTILQEVGTTAVQEKVSTILRLLETNILANPVEQSLTPDKYHPLSKEDIDTHINQAQHSKSGIFDSMQHLLANAQVPDQSVIKDYAEKVTAKNYLNIQEMIIDMTCALNMPTPEVYIARGDNELEIKGFEGSTAFILVGIKYLEEESEYKMTQEELRFVLAIEIAHLYFEHARITSTDVWRGAMDKGMFVLNTVLAIVPGLTLIASSFDRLKRVGNILEKVGSVSEKIQGFTSNYAENSNLFSEEEKKEQELLAISRLMELIADRVGLILSNGNLEAAIRSILISTPRYATELPMIQRYGLSGMLAKQDAKQDFIYQDLSIRLHALCSFYLSEDYDILKGKLVR